MIVLAFFGGETVVEVAAIGECDPDHDGVPVSVDADLAGTHAWQRAVHLLAGFAGQVSEVVETAWRAGR